MASANLNAVIYPSAAPMAYEVSVNDGGPDGGNTVQIVVYAGVAGSSSYLGETNVEAAVNALAASLDAVTGFTLVSVEKVELIQTSL